MLTQDRAAGVQAASGLCTRTKALEDSNPDTLPATPELQGK